MESTTVPSRRETTRATLSESSITRWFLPVPLGSNHERSVSASRSGGAGGTGPPQHDVVRCDVVAQAPPGALDQRLELGILEGRTLAAAVADRVMVVVAAR